MNDQNFNFSLLHRRKVHPQKTSVNAYVVFSSEDAVALALERSVFEITRVGRGAV